MPPKSVILVEENSGDIKRIFAQMIAAEALANGQRVTYVSPRSKGDILVEMEAYGTGVEHLEVIERIRDAHKLCDLCDGDVCIIESLPLFFIDIVDREIVHIMNTIQHASRAGNRLVLITFDIGILPAKQEKIVRSMADGVIELTLGFNEQKINRYLHVHKLRGKNPADKLVPYSIEDSGRSIYVDTRERYA